MRRRQFMQQTGKWIGVPPAIAVVTACSTQSGAGGSEKVALSNTPVSIRLPNSDPTPTNQQYFEQIVAHVKDRYNDKIQLVNEPWLGNWTERYEKWTAMALGGDAPDLLWLCCELLRPYFSAGNAQALDAYIKRDWKMAQVADFSKGMWEGMQLDKKQYGIPVYANTPTLFVNTTHFKEAGLAPPPDDWNNAKFLDYVSKLHRPADGQWGFMMSNYNQPNRHVLFVWAWGGEVNDPKDGPVVTKLTYDNPKTVEALTFLYDLIWKQRFAPPTDADRGGVGAQAAFQAGKAGVYLDGSHVLPAFKRQQEQDSSFNWDVAFPVRGPSGGQGARIGNDGYMIWKGSKHLEEAWAVLKEIYTPEVQKARVQITASQPAVKSAMPAFAQQYPGKNMKVISSLVDTARPDPNAYWKDSATVNSMVVKNLQATFERNEMTVAEATRTMMDQIRGYYASAK